MLSAPHLWLESHNNYLQGCCRINSKIFYADHLTKGLNAKFYHVVNSTMVDHFTGWLATSLKAVISLAPVLSTQGKDRLTYSGL